MEVYVESNFVLELALLQDQHPACDAFLELAEAGIVTMLLPVYSLTEPYETSIRTAKRRNEIALRLQAELRQLQRSPSYATQTAAVEEVVDLLVGSQNDEEVRLREVSRKLADVAELVPLDAETFQEALILQRQGKFSPQDSVVYASVLRRMKSAGDIPKVFLTRDSDFDLPDVRAELDGVDCKLMSRFDAGLDYVQHRLGLQPGADASDTIPPVPPPN